MSDVEVEMTDNEMEGLYLLVTLHDLRRKARQYQSGYSQIEAQWNRTPPRSRWACRSRLIAAGFIKPSDEGVIFWSQLTPRGVEEIARRGIDVQLGLIIGGNDD